MTPIQGSGHDYVLVRRKGAASWTARKATGLDVLGGAQFYTREWPKRHKTDEVIRLETVAAHRRLIAVEHHSPFVISSASITPKK